MVGETAIGEAPQLRGKWLTRGYRIDGGLIKPVPGSEKREYSPLDRYSEAVARKDTTSVVEDLARLDLDCEQSVLYFVNRWGLLGIFQHELESVWYIPNAEGRITPRSHHPTGSVPEVVARVSGKRELRLPLDAREYLLLQGYIEIEDGQFARRATKPLDHGTLAQRLAGMQEPEPFELVMLRELAEFAAGNRGKGEVRRTGALQPWLGNTVRTIESYFSQFFPDAPREALDMPTYPALDSAEIWDELCEPLSLFREAVTRFQTIARAAAENRRFGTVSDEFRNRLIELNRNLELIRQTAVVEPETVSWPVKGASPVRNVKLWPSLLACAFELLLEDLSGGRSPQLCKNETCKRVFTGNRSYCQDSCLNAQNQREERRRRAARARALKEGKTP